MGSFIGFTSLIVAGGIGLILSSFQLSHLLRNSQLTVFNRTLLSLGISDLLSCLSFISNGIANALKSRPGIAYTLTSMNVFIVGSVFHMIFIGIQRLVAVKTPLKVNLIFNSTRCTISLALLWVAASTYGIVVSRIFTDYAPIANSLSVFTTGVTLLTLYAGIACKIKQRNRPICRGTQSKRNKQNRLVFLHSLLVTFAFICSYFPFAIEKLFLSSFLLSRFIFDTLMAMNPIINPCIYFYVQLYRRKRPQITVRNFSTEEYELRPKRFSKIEHG